jgi:hypothetical protein
MKIAAHNKIAACEKIAIARSVFYNWRNQLA